MLDNDGEGRRAYKNYETFFGDSFAKNAYQYEGLSKKDFVLEDIISDDYQKIIVDYTGCRNIKNALTRLYFDDNKDEIIDQIDEKTKGNLNILKQKIRAHFAAK